MGCSCGRICPCGTADHMHRVTLLGTDAGLDCANGHHTRREAYSTLKQAPPFYGVGGKV